MKPSLTSVSRRQDTHGSYVTFIPVQSTEMSIPAWYKKQQGNTFVRLGIREPEHLRMRGRNV